MRKGTHVTEETKIKMSKAHKGLITWNKGKLCPQISKAMKGKPSGRKGKKGKPHSEETKRKISETKRQSLFKTGFKKGHITSEETLRKMLITKAKRPKKMSTLIKKVDDVFSLYVRLKDSKDGMNQCITCGRWLPIKELDCGHYISRENHSTRFNEKNVAPQCRSCNRFHEGRKDEFALALIEKYGDGILEELNQQKHTVKKYTKEEFEELYEHYKSEVEKLEVKDE